MELFLFISRAVTARSFCSPGGRGGASYRPRSSTEAWEKPHSWRPAPLLRSYPSRKTPAMGKDWIQPELFPCWCPAFRVHPKPLGFAEGIMEPLHLENPSKTESSRQPQHRQGSAKPRPQGLRLHSDIPEGQWFFRMLDCHRSLGIHPGSTSALPGSAGKSH